MNQWTAKEQNAAVDGYSTLITAPAAPLLTTADAKESIPGLDFADDDSLIDSYVGAATDMLDAQFGELGRALVTQTWAYTLPAFPTRSIALPYSPVQAVSAVTYYDADDAGQTLSAATYRLASMPHGAVLDLVSGAAWPSTYDRKDAVTVTYVAGYGDLGADVPEGIRLAAKALVNHFYAHPSAVSERAGSETPLMARYLLNKYRVPSGFF